MTRLKNRKVSELRIGDKIVWDYGNVTKIENILKVGNYSTTFNFIGIDNVLYTRTRNNNTVVKVL